MLMNTPEFPTFVHVETLNKCNLKCIMCPITLGENKRPDMSQEVFEKIVKECAKYSDFLQVFGLYMLNEPLLDQKLPERIALAKQYGIKTTQIATNVELLSNERIKALFNSGLDELILSIESIYPEKHEKIRVGSNFSRVLKNFENLIQFKKNNDVEKPKIIVRMLAFEQNKDVWEEYTNFWLEKGADHVIIVNLHNWGGKFKEFDRPLVGIDVCTYLWNMMVIQSDGNVSLCCLDSSGEFQLGNVKDESLYDIWHGKEFEHVRRLFKEKNITKCKNCNWNPNEFIGIWDKKIERLTLAP